jgi:hypothetical protein
MAEELSIDEVARIAAAWVDGRREEVIAEMGAIKPGEAMRIGCRIRNLALDSDLDEYRLLGEFRETLERQRF